MGNSHIPYAVLEALKSLNDVTCCFYCKSEFEDSWDTCLDHIIPRKKGGKNIIENLVFCCRACNSSKSSLMISEWKAKLISKRDQHKLMQMHYNTILRSIEDIENG